jgi:hypothetical protein
MCYSSELSKQRCKKRGPLINIHSKVSLAKIQLQNNSTNVKMKAIHLASQVQLTNVFLNDLHRSTHNMAVHWYWYGDTCSKVVFFNFHEGWHRHVCAHQ